MTTNRLSQDDHDDTKRGVSRRQFLKISAAGLAAAGATSIPLNLNAEQLAKVIARRQAGALRVAWGGAPVTLDPLTASADTELAFLNAVYDYLIDTNAQSELVPRLATSWDVSEDGLEVTLQIAEGVKFHDGTDLTIDDIIWTFERLRSGGPTADLFANVESVEAGGGNSVVFKLANTEPDFLYNLTDNHAVILKAGAEGIGETFNGTGPFKLEAYEVGLRATFSANADYFDGAPGVETLEFQYFEDVSAAINALRGGVVDMVLRMDDATFLSLTAETGLNAVDVATNGHDLVRLRADRAPGDDERVRRAFKMATDRKAIFERLKFGFGAEGRDTPIGPLYAAYYTEDFPLPERDPEAARALLAEAGYPDGLQMTLYVPNLPDRVALAQALQAQWEEAGIRVEIEPQEEALYYAEEGWLSVDLGITPWGSRPTPQFYLDVAYKTGAVWNEAHYSDAELDEWIDIAGSTLDQDERVNAYREIQRILIERGPVIIPYFFAQYAVMAENVEGVMVHPFAGRSDFRKATV